MGNRRSSVVISTLEAHPNALEILSISSQLPCITDLGLAELAGAWQNTPSSQKPGGTRSSPTRRSSSTRCQPSRPSR